MTQRDDRKHYLASKAELVQALDKSRREAKEHWDTGDVVDVLSAFVVADGDFVSVDDADILRQRESRAVAESVALKSRLGESEDRVIELDSALASTLKEREYAMGRAMAAEAAVESLKAQLSSAIDSHNTTLNQHAMRERSEKRKRECDHSFVGGSDAQPMDEGCSKCGIEKLDWLGSAEGRLHQCEWKLKHSETERKRLVGDGATDAAQWVMVNSELSAKVSSLEAELNVRRSENRDLSLAKERVTGERDAFREELIRHHAAADRWSGGAGRFVADSGTDVVSPLKEWRPTAMLDNVRRMPWHARVGTHVPHKEWCLGSDSLVVRDAGGVVTCRECAWTHEGLIGEDAVPVELLVHGAEKARLEVDRMCAAKHRAEAEARELRGMVRELRSQAQALELELAGYQRVLEECRAQMDELAARVDGRGVEVARRPKTCPGSGELVGGSTPGVNMRCEVCGLEYVVCSTRVPWHAAKE